MRAHELLVRGDDMLARAHGRADITVSRLQSAHDLDHDADRAVAHDLVEIICHGAGKLRARTAGQNARHAQIAPPERELVEGLADGAEAEQCNVHGVCLPFSL